MVGRAPAAEQWLRQCCSSVSSEGWSLEVGEGAGEVEGDARELTTASIRAKEDRRWVLRVRRRSAAMELPAAVALGLRRARARLLGVRVERGRECERFGSPGRAWAGQGEGAGMGSAW